MTLNMSIALNHNSDIGSCGCENLTRYVRLNVICVRTFLNKIFSLINNMCLNQYLIYTLFNNC